MVCWVTSTALFITGAVGKSSDRIRIAHIDKLCGPYLDDGKFFSFSLFRWRHMFGSR